VRARIAPLIRTSSEAVAAAPGDSPTVTTDQDPVLVRAAEDRVDTPGRGGRRGTLDQPG